MWRSRNTCRSFPVSGCFACSRPKASGGILCRYLSFPCYHVPDQIHTAASSSPAHAHKWDLVSEQFSCFLPGMSSPERGCHVLTKIACLWSNQDMDCRREGSMKQGSVCVWRILSISTRTNPVAGGYRCSSRNMDGRALLVHRFYHCPCLFMLFTHRRAQRAQILLTP